MIIQAFSELSKLLLTWLAMIDYTYIVIFMLMLLKRVALFLEIILNTDNKFFQEYSLNYFQLTLNTSNMIHAASLKRIFFQRKKVMARIKKELEESLFTK